MNYAKQLLVNLLRYGDNLELGEAKEVEKFKGDWGKLKIELPFGKAFIFIEQEVYNKVIRGVN